MEDSDYEWSCFATHQAVEKAPKVVFLKLGMDAWGYTPTVLIGNLPEIVDTTSNDLVTYARILDKYYIPTRYPNGIDSGAPTDFRSPGD